MCGPKFCSMNISAKVESFTPEEAAAAANGTGAERLVGISGDDGQRRADFSDLAGGWTQDPAFDEVLAAQRQIDRDTWK
jgi:hypothetical protein